MDPVDLTRARRAGGHGDGDPDVGVVLADVGCHRTFADGRRAGQAPSAGYAERSIASAALLKLALERGNLVGAEASYPS